MPAAADVCQIAKMLATLALGVLLPLAACQSDQSQLEPNEIQPIAGPFSTEGKRQIETPEVVLQLKYDRGELNRIYLAQFRKNKETWVPSVPATDNLCSDLCHAGLGGPPCGPSCSDLIPVGLKTMLQDANSTAADGYGEPRTAVCPTLCQFDLGHPLCTCAGAGMLPTSWSDVCAAFCLADNYVLRGCPSCSETATRAATIAMGRLLTTSDGWAAWCSAQCRQGQGGAACNCDRSPL